MEIEEPLKTGFTVYSKSGCPNCTKVKKLLIEKKLFFVEINCDDYIIEDDFLYIYTGTVNDQEVTNIKQYLEDLALDAALQAQRAENQKKCEEIAARRSEALNKVKYLNPIYSGHRLGKLVYYKDATYEIVQINYNRSGFSFDLFAKYDKQWLPIGISPQGRVNNVMANEFTEV
jgi:glutaredoxin